MSPSIKTFSIPIIVLALAGCSTSEPAHPWLDLGASSPHRIIEFAGADAGQIVIAMDPAVSREQALELGSLIQSQAPPGAIVNAQLYNDEATARGWRTAQAQMRVEHLLVLVTINPGTELNEVRWARPDSLPASNGALSAPGADTTPPPP